MSLIIYNTKTGRKETLEPIETGHVKMYVCGITAYDYCHIGHARSALVFDMIVRYLRFRNFKVTYIRNFTDIDDKIINRAREQNTTTEELAKRFIDEFHADMKILGVAPPNLEPKATEHIPQIIKMIDDLVTGGYAYQVEGDVYYSVDKFGGYGSLSGRNLEEMKAGARITINENKNNPMDFALWKGSKPGEPTWDSPWGPGRPGWHIECSAMSRHYLGDAFDIHGGGKDLVFPHHENEIAQSEALSGRPCVNLWIHHGFVTIKEEKMSKSLGNFLTIRDVVSKYHPEVLRLLIFSTHYRTPLDYSEAAMRETEAGLDRLYACLAAIQYLPRSGAADAGAVAEDADREKIRSLASRFQEAMDNDFNSAQALGYLFEGVKCLNRISRGLADPPADSDLILLREGAGVLKELSGILGLLQCDPGLYLEEKQDRIIRELGLDRAAIDGMVRERVNARARKDWALADKIRDKLFALGIDLKDGQDGTSWTVRQNPESVSGSLCRS